MATKKTEKQVFCTTDYDRFQKLLGNRDVTEERVKKIMASVNKVGYITSPIIINEFDEIIDGQGRVEAFKRLGIPVEFIIHKGARLEQCIEMNMKQTKWSVSDFCRSYAAQGNINYVNLIKLLNQFPDFSLDSIVNIMGYQGSHISKGNLVFDDTEYEYMVNLLPDLAPYVCLKKTISGQMRYLLSAIKYCIEFGADRKRLLDVVFDNASNFAIANTRDALDQIQKLYNFRLSSDKRIYFTTEFDRLKAITASERNRKKRNKE